MTKPAVVRLFGAMAMTLGLLGLSACQRGAEEPQGDNTVSAEDIAALRELGETSPTLARVKARGYLNCGVHGNLMGFAYKDNRGQWRGFDVDFCRATAAAVLGRPDAVRFYALTAEERFPALVSGKVDVLWRNTSWTMERDSTGQVAFAGINYYDGQGFLTRRALNLSSAAELTGARICVHGNSTSELNVEDYFRTREIEFKPVILATEEAARQTYAREECDALTGDISSLAAARSVMNDPRQHVILHDFISKEPLGPVVRAGDERWEAVVRWTLNALISAEEFGVAKSNVARLAQDGDRPEVNRLLGLEGDFGPKLGLARTWARDAIAASGNYGEIFENNVGQQSTLDLDRGLNQRWNAEQGGLIYGLPIR